MVISSSMVSRVVPAISDTMARSSFNSAFKRVDLPHQSLENQTPDVAYETASGGGAQIVDKYPPAVDEPPVPLRSTGGSSTAVSIADLPAEAETGQRRTAACEV